MEEVSVADPQGEPRFEPRYTCLLCRQNAPLTEMLRHLIGRKHRQKYLVKFFKHSLSPPGEPFFKMCPSVFFNSLVETNSVPFLCRKPNGQTW